MTINGELNESKKKRNEYDVVISLCKVIAMFLIINSHADLLFPDKLRFLATGGALGNELFFFIGGILFRIRFSEGFLSFAWRKYVRLYLPTYIMSLFLFIFGYIHLYEFKKFIDIFHLLIWPSQFWFVSAFFLFTLVMYFLVKTPLFKKKSFIIYSSLSFILLFVLYYICIFDKSIWIVEDAKIPGTTIYFKCFYSFFVFTLGYYIQTEKRDSMSINNKQKIMIISTFVISIIIFFLFKLFLNRSIIPMEFQIVSQPITIICVVSLYCSLRSLLGITNTRIKRVINYLGSITLESFLVQFQVIQWLLKTEIRFPLNYLLSFFLILMISFTFHHITEFLCNLILYKRKQQI